MSEALVNNSRQFVNNQRLCRPQHRQRQAVENKKILCARDGWRFFYSMLVIGTVIAFHSVRTHGAFESSLNERR